MDAQQFLAEFGHIANAPGGVARLRNLILELAIRGQLLLPSVGATDARTLLAEIENHRLEQIQAGKLRRQTPLPDISDSELLFKLPKGWAFERLGNICEIVRGVTFPSSRKQTTRSVSSVACLRTSNIQSEIDWRDLIFIDPELVGREDQWIQMGDTMISMANSYELVGKVALIREVKERATFGGFIAAVRPHVLEPEYLYLVLRSPYMQSKMRVTASQTTNIANISLGGMRPIPTPIPPKEEQTRIVAKVDELMALCDRLEDEQQKRRKLQNTLRQATLQAVAKAQSPHELQTSWARLESNFGRLFSAPEDVVSLKSLILNIAMRGFLVEQSVLETSAHKQLQAIEAERLQRVADKTIKASTAIPLPRAEELPYSLPKGWVWARVADLVEVGTGATPRKSEHDYYGGEIPWYTSAATNDKFARVPETYISEKALRETNCKIFPAGSLIVALYGQGKTRGQVSELTLAGATNQAIAALVFFEASVRTKRFLKYYFEKIYDEIRLQAEGGPQPNLSVGKIKETFVPLPPVEEQERIVARLDELLGQCEGMSNLLKAKNAAAQQLARAAVSNLTGIAIEQEEDEPVKVPQTELISRLRLGQAPSVKAQAPLASLLARHKGELSAQDLWQRYGGEIDAFYAQLKTEVAHGWIEEPAVAEVREKTTEAA